MASVDKRKEVSCEHASVIAASRGTEDTGHHFLGNGRGRSGVNTLSLRIELLVIVKKQITPPGRGRGERRESIKVTQEGERIF